MENRKDFIQEDQASHLEIKEEYGTWRQSNPASDCIIWFKSNPRLFQAVFHTVLLEMYKTCLFSFSFCCFHREADKETRLL